MCVTNKRILNLKTSTNLINTSKVNLQYIIIYVIHNRTIIHNVCVCVINVQLMFSLIFYDDIW